MKKSFVLMTVIGLLAGITTVHANENDKNVIYIGGGSAQSGNPLKSSATPGSIGYLRLSNENDAVIGFDVGGEGTLLDSTWGQRSAVKQANSYNLLVGKNLMKNESSRFDATFLVGMRRSTTSCPSSYLGYQCYADAAPDNKYDLNYGLVLAVSYKSVMVGVRATGESAQALLGLRF